MQLASFLKFLRVVNVVSCVIFCSVKTIFHFYAVHLLGLPFLFLFEVYDVDVVCDALARRMKGVVEASRKEALRQQDAGIAPPDDKSEGSAPEDLPAGDDGGGCPNICPRKPMVVM